MALRHRPDRLGRRNRVGPAAAACAANPSCCLVETSRSCEVRSEPTRRRRRPYRVMVVLRQKGPINEQTTLGFAMNGCQGYPIRIPDRAARLAAITLTIRRPVSMCMARQYASASRCCCRMSRRRVAVDPDQVLIDRDPSNNYWKPPVRIRFAPVYTFLEETDLTNDYDRWNLIFGPWIYGSIYDDPWYTRIDDDWRSRRPPTARRSSTAASTRPTARITAMWSWAPTACGPRPRSPCAGWIQHRAAVDHDACRATTTPSAAVFGRYVFHTKATASTCRRSSTSETFAAYQQNFLPFPKTPEPGGSASTRRVRSACITGLII